jgi:predicted amino acid dehydrogenase
MTTMSRELQNPIIYRKNKSLISLITSNQIAGLDSVAFANISSHDIQNIGIDQSTYTAEIMNDQPLLFAILDTFFGRIGLVLIPIAHEEIYNNSNALLHEINKAISLAKISGAKCASLTGLIPSATNYGYDLKIESNNSDFLVTTGHGTTVSAMIFNIEHVLNNVKRSIALETIAFVGLGSIGLTTLKLMLSVLTHPKKLIICDMFSKLKDLEQIASKLSLDFNYQGEVVVAGSVGFNVPQLIYDEATLVVGATNIPNILSTDLLKPGTIIVDDSAPHIFDPTTCIARFTKQKDVLVIQGGKLTLPTQTHFTYNYNLKSIFSKERFKKIISVKLNEIMGCTLGSVLPLASNNIPTTLGIVELEVATLYYKFLKKQRITASSLQCEGYYYKQDDIKQFIISKRVPP